MTCAHVSTKLGEIRIPVPYCIDPAGPSAMTAPICRCGSFFIELDGTLLRHSPENIVASSFVFQDCFILSFYWKLYSGVAIDKLYV